MQIDWWTLALQAVNAVVLIWLLQRFLFRPVADIIAARRAAAERLLAEAEAERDRARAEHASASAEAEAQMARRAEVVKAAEAEAAARRDALVAAAREAAAKLSSEAEADIARARETAAAQAADRAARLSVDIAGRLFQRLPPEAQVSGFIAGLAQALAALPEDARDGIAPRGHPLRLRAPRPLEAEEAASCRAALSEALGRQVEIEIEVDPNVIAGLEAEGPLGSARNSFRADLEKLTEAMTCNDARSA